MKFRNIIAVLTLGLALAACDFQATPTSSSGVSKATIKITPTATFEGKKVTTEQFNLLERQKRANTAGSVKHLYILSAFSGDVIIYSTVQGKVTSSGKRLTPNSIAAMFNTGLGQSEWGIPIEIGGSRMFTREVLQDDGTYGSSNPYLYWIDVRGNGHEHYVSGGQIIHVSDVPMQFPKIILNLEETAESAGVQNK